MTYPAATAAVALTGKGLSGTASGLPMTPALGRNLCGVIERAYLTTGLTADPEFGFLGYLIGHSRMAFCNPTYKQQELGSGQTLLLGVLEEFVKAEMKRIVTEDVLAAFCGAPNGSGAVRVAGLTAIEYQPTPQDMYEWLRNAFCTDNLITKVSIDAVIAEPIRGTLVEILTAITKYANACKMREIICKAPVPESDQYEHVVQRLQDIPALDVFNAYWTSKSLLPEAVRTVSALRTALVKYAEVDPRISKKLEEERGTGRGYAAVVKASSTNENGKGRSPSSERARSGAPQSSDQSMKEQIRLLTKQLGDSSKAKGKEQCTYPDCLMAGHSIGGCWKAIAAVEAEAVRKKTSMDAKDGVTPRGRGRGQRGGRSSDGA
jgi:hypothetical protein